MNYFQIIFIVFIIFSLIKVLTKSSPIKAIEKLFWVSVWIFGGIIILFPQTSFTLSNFLGIKRGADVITYSAIILILYLVYKLYDKQEKQNKKIKEIATKIALKEESTAEG